MGCAPRVCLSHGFDARRARGAGSLCGLVPVASSLRKNTAYLGISQSVSRELDENLVPAEIRQMLLEHHREQVFSTLGMTAELFRLLELFTANDIPALIVKGPALAMQAYGDPTMRSYGDLDFLVRQRNIRRATESLQAAGFQATVPLSAIDAGKIPGQYLFCKTDTKLVVELHNDFTLRYFPRPLPIEEFFARRIRVCIDGHEAPALSVEDELVLICIHGAKHLWDRLSWIADVAALVTRKSDIDWQAAMETARKWERSACCTPACASLLICFTPLFQRRCSRLYKGTLGAAKLATCARTWLTAADTAAPTLFERASYPSANARQRIRSPGLSAPTFSLSHGR